MPADRLNGCKALGWTEIEVEEKDYSETLVIEANRYREKTWREKLREAEELERILRPKAKERQATSGPAVYGGKPVRQNSDKAVIDTKVEVAHALNTSHDTLAKVKAIAKEKPELLDKIDTIWVCGRYYMILYDTTW